MIATPDTKCCFACKQELGCDYFYVTRKVGCKPVYSSKCKVCHRHAVKRRMLENPGLSKERSKAVAARKAADPHGFGKRINTTQRLSNATCVAALKELVKEVLGAACVRCGFADVRALQIDHKHSDGSTERKMFNGGKHYQFLKKVISEGNRSYQLLCANCNWIKRHEEGHHSGPSIIIPNPRQTAIYVKYRHELLEAKVQ